MALKESKSVLSDIIKINRIITDAKEFDLTFFASECFVRLLW